MLLQNGTNMGNLQSRLSEDPYQKLWRPLAKNFSDNP